MQEFYEVLAVPSLCSSEARSQGKSGCMISVILPTIRPSLIDDCLHNINDAAGDCGHEVVVVADFEPGGYSGFNRWIVRDRKGVVDAINVGYAHCEGDYIFLTNDETSYGPSAIKLLHEAVQSRPMSLMYPRHEPYFNFVYYDKVFAPFPCAARDVFESLGGFFDPRYYAFYADPDLSLRAYAAGIPLEQIDDAVIYHKNRRRADNIDTIEKYRAIDQQLFRERWAHLGEFRDC